MNTNTTETSKKASTTTKKEYNFTADYFTSLLKISESETLKKINACTSKNEQKRDAMKDAFFIELMKDDKRLDRIAYIRESDRNKRVSLNYTVFNTFKSEIFTKRHENDRESVDTSVHFYTVKESERVSKAVANIANNYIAYKNKLATIKDDTKKKALYDEYSKKYKVCEIELINAIKEHKKNLNSKAHYVITNDYDYIVDLK